MRSIWNGTLAVGAVTVPIKLHAATESKTVRFRQVHLADGARIKQRRVCSAEDEEVPSSEVVKGFEVRKGEYVVLDDDEIRAAAGEQSRTIDIERFVDAEEIDPVHFDHPYFLGAGDDAGASYRLLHDAMEKTGRIAIGRFVFHNREYLAAVRPTAGVLVLQTMRFADELVDADELDVKRPSKAPTDREVKMAQALVESLHEDWRPEDYHDTYREAVLKAIEAKAKGKELKAAPAPEPTEAPDLMAALEASLGKAA